MQGLPVAPAAPPAGIRRLPALDQHTQRRERTDRNEIVFRESACRERRFERWVRDHLQDGFSLQEAAAALATSARSLQRRCQTVLGKSPLAYFQDLRVERAQSLLHGSGLDVDAIAAEVGYEDGATLRTLLRERLGRGVRDLRADLR